MEQRTLEITLQQATDLGKVKYFGKMAVYAVVSLSDSLAGSNHKSKSTVDHDGDTNPAWNFPMKFKIAEAALQADSLVLHFKLVCQRYFGDSDVGEAKISAKELLDDPAGAVAADGWRCTSIPVMVHGGGPQGQLSFSYKFSGKRGMSNPAPPPTDWSNVFSVMANSTVKIVQIVMDAAVVLDKQENDRSMRTGNTS